MASPSFQTGRYSKHLPTGLLERYGEALRDVELTSLRDEIALVDALLSDEIARDDAGRSDVVLDMIEQRRKLVDSERRRMVELEQMVTAEQAMLLITAISDAVRRHVHDPDTLTAIAAEIARLTNLPRTAHGREPGDGA